MTGDGGPGALSLDVWYTLIYQTAPARREYEAARAAAWRDALHAAGVPLATVDGKLAALAVEAARREEAGRAFSLAEQARWIAPRRLIDVARLSGRIGQALAAARVARAPGVLGALDALADRGIALGIVSNVVNEPPEAMRTLLVRTGLARRAEAIVLSAEVGAAKPSGRPVETLLDRLGVRADATLHVGDTDLDARAAWRAGASAARYVGVRRHWPAPSGAPAAELPIRLPEFLRWTDLPDGLPSLWRRATRVAERARQASA